MAGKKINDSKKPAKEPVKQTDKEVNSHGDS